MTTGAGSERPGSERPGSEGPGPSTVEVSVTGGQMHVARWGTGDRNVLGIHGITASSAMMAPVARLLGVSFSLFAPDLRGRGMSAQLGPPYGMRAPSSAEPARSASTAHTRRGRVRLGAEARKPVVGVGGGREPLLPRPHRPRGCNRRRPRERHRAILSPARSGPESAPLAAWSSEPSRSVHEEERRRTRRCEEA